MIKMIGFDLDGTVGDTLPLCMKVFGDAVSPYAGHRLSEKEIIQTFGVNEEGMIKAVAPDDWERALADYHRLYMNMHGSCPEPFEGIGELIMTLRKKGIIVVMVTGKGAESCRMTLDQFGMNDLFDEIRTGRADYPCKTEIILELLKKYQLEKEEFCYIGDDVSDVRACQAAGVRCLSAAWKSNAPIGRLTAENSWYVFDRVEALRQYLSFPELL